ncbi:transposase [Corynebacterium pseudodiphtheriticum]|uniref:Transposase n=1 Tax=Corynebacterium pseudodiphtheriticum TaxID=37637 RepID=A0ABT7FZE6_9CORY|nr:transposase [Corynebacterium pseudodiphtheriticum]MDK4290847.1 transposase [Corynebacterium pseudodiphtheriticum]MDK4322525.1 transposase [Corynebacterium pseudodiphtheriticum]
MPKKFDQDTKDQLVRLLEDRILTQNLSLQQACKIVAPKLDFHGTRQDNGRRRLVVKDESLNLPEDLAAENARLRREKPQATRHKRVVESCLGFFAS